MASIIQAATPADISLVEHIERLGLNGVLILAVFVLWRKLEAKDVILMQNYDRMAAALESSKATNGEMTRTLGVIRDTVEKFNNVRSVTHPSKEAKNDRI